MLLYIVFYCRPQEETKALESVDVSESVQDDTTPSIPVGEDDVIVPSASNTDDQDDISKTPDHIDNPLPDSVTDTASQEPPPATNLDTNTEPAKPPGDSPPGAEVSNKRAGRRRQKFKPSTPQD